MTLIPRLFKDILIKDNNCVGAYNNHTMGIRCDAGAHTIEHSGPFLQGITQNVGLWSLAVTGYLLGIWLEYFVR
jgi:hypothetical protein